MKSKLRSFYVLTLCNDADLDLKYRPGELSARSRAQARIRATLAHRKALDDPKAEVIVIYVEENYGRERGGG